jgi:hypothetical protein
MGSMHFVDNLELVAFATELKSGKPISGADLSIYPNGAAVSGQSSVVGEETGIVTRAWEWITGGPSAVTSSLLMRMANRSTTRRSPKLDESGLARMEFCGLVCRIHRAVRIFSSHDAVTMSRSSPRIPITSGRTPCTWYKRPDVDSLRWFVFDDRKMYRPKEEVSVKGYIRKVTGGRLGDVEALGDSASGLTWSAKDSRNNEIASGTGNLNAFGAFDFKFKLPDNANLGYSRIDLSTNTRIDNGRSYSHQFQIQEFRRPEFEVTTKVETEAPHFVGGKAEGVGRCEVLLRRRPRECGDELDRNRDTDDVHASESRRLHVRNMGAVVASLRLRRRMAGRWTDRDIQRRNRRERSSSSEDRFRFGQTSASLQHQRLGGSPGCQSTNVVEHNDAARSSIRSIRRHQDAADVRSRRARR